jgi:IS5 family transposase
MNYQKTFTDFEYENRKKITKREGFLKMMDKIIPWEKWVGMISPYYPSGRRGRPPRGIETMLRMYFLQIWFNLSDEAVEDSIYDSYAMRSFMKVSFGEEQAPDATTLLKFRHLLEKNKLGEILFRDLTSKLEENGCIMRGGTIIDATIIEAPSSTKNVSRERDPEMHQAKKGNKWHFGMKVHVGVDAGSGYTHSVTATAANVSDIAEAQNLIREDDDVVYGDAGYIGIEKREEIITDEHKRGIEYRINRRPGKFRKDPENIGNRWELFIERRKSSVRSKVEHVFRIVKIQFGYSKVVYRGIAKNLNRFYMLFASSNAYMYAKSGRLWAL